MLQSPHFLSGKFHGHTGELTLCPLYSFASPADKLSTLLGKGTFGKVFRATERYAVRLASLFAATCAPAHNVTVPPHGKTHRSRPSIQVDPDYKNPDKAREVAVKVVRAIDKYWDAALIETEILTRISDAADGMELYVFSPLTFPLNL